MEVLPTILMEAVATHTEAPRVCMDTMEVMAMVDITARGPLSQVTVMLSAITTEAPRVSMDTMVVTMARDLLSQDTMAVPALMSTRAVLTTMDLMDMPMVAAATSRLTGHTLPMVSVLLTLTK